MSIVTLYNIIKLHIALNIDPSAFIDADTSIETRLCCRAVWLRLRLHVFLWVYGFFVLL